MFFDIVDKYEEMIGSYAPKTDIQMHDCTSEQAPAGFFARGTYKGKAIVFNFFFFFFKCFFFFKFLDHDGIVHMQFEYIFKIDKEW